MNTRLATRMVAILLVVTSVGICAQAQTAVTWDSNSGNWATSTNWSGGVVPNNSGSTTYAVTIAPGSGTVRVNADITNTDLTLGNTFGSSAAILQSVAGDSLYIVNELVVNSGAQLNFNTSGSTLTVGGPITNNGTLTLGSGGLSLSSTGNMNNTGTIYLGNGSSASMGNVTNSGNIYTGSPYANGGNTLDINGTLTNNSGASLTLGGYMKGPGDVLNVTGATTNAGTLYIGSSGSSTATFSSSVNNSGTFETGSVGGDFGNDTVTVNGMFTNTGSLVLQGTGIVSGSGDVLNLNGGLTNSGSISLSSGTTLNVTGGSQITDIPAGMSYQINGTYNIVNGGNSTSPFLQVTTIEGNLELGGGQTTTITPNGGTLKIAGSGYFEAQNQLFTLAGALNNAGSFTLTNTSGSLGAVTNTGSFYVEGSTVSTGNMTNSANIIIGYNGELETGANNADTVNINGTLTNKAGAQMSLGGFNGPGWDGFNVTGATNNAGTIYISGTIATFSGNVINSGTIQTGIYDTLPVTVTVNGTFTNTATGTLALNGPQAFGDVVNLKGLSNAGSIALVSGATLDVTSNSKVTNSATISLQGGTLSLAGALNNSGTISVENVGEGAATATMGAVTSTGTFIVGGGASLSTGNMTNSGNIYTGDAGPGELPGGNTLSIKGTLTNNAGAQLEIGGSSDGNIYGDVLNVKGATNNAGTIDITGSIATFSGNVTNSGTFQTGLNELNGRSTVTVNGTFTNTATGTLTENPYVGDVLELHLLSNAGTITIGNLEKIGLTGAVTDTNTGRITIGSGQVGDGGGTLSLGKNATLSNSGTIVLISGDNNLMTASGTGATLSNSNTIEGSGTISKLAIVNYGNIEANGSKPLLIFPSSAGLNNYGTLTVAAGSTMKIGTSTASGLNNFSSTTDTLTGGVYSVAGTLDFAGADIVTDAASIVLDGSGKIVNTTNNTNALAGLTTIASTGSLSLGSKATLTTAGNLANNGALSLASGTTLTVTGTYNQTAGTTTVDGTLTASGIAGIILTSGTIQGAGTLNGNVSNAGTINAGNPGAAGLLSITGGYTQLSSGALSVSIGGTKVGTQFSQLKISGAASLGGTLTVALINGFTPTVGQTFTVLTTTGGLGGTTFTNTTIAINSTEQFDISYTSTGVVLTVVSTAGSPNSNKSGQPAEQAADLKHAVSTLVAAKNNLRRAVGRGISRQVEVGGIGVENNIAHVETPRIWEHVIATPGWDHVKAVTEAPRAITPGAHSGLAQHVGNWNGVSHALPVHAPLAGWAVANPRRAPLRMMPITLPAMR